MGKGKHFISFTTFALICSLRCKMQERHIQWLAEALLQSDHLCIVSLWYIHFNVTFSCSVCLPRGVFVQDLCLTFMSQNKTKNNKRWVFACQQSRHPPFPVVSSYTFHCCKLKIAESYPLSWEPQEATGSFWMSPPGHSSAGEFISISACSASRVWARRIWKYLGGQTQIIILNLCQLWFWKINPFQYWVASGKLFIVNNLFCISRQLHCLHMPQEFGSVCDMGITIEFLILSLIKSAFCFGGSLYSKDCIF